MLKRLDTVKSRNSLKLLYPPFIHSSLLPFRLPSISMYWKAANPRQALGGKKSSPLYYWWNTTGVRNFFSKDQRVNIVGFMVSFNCHSEKAATANTYTCKCGCASVRFYLHRQAASWLADLIFQCTQNAGEMVGCTKGSGAQS